MARMLVRGSVLLLFALVASVARAEEPEGCRGLIASARPLVLRASLARDEVGLTFIGHPTFLIETPLCPSACAIGLTSSDQWGLV